MQNSALQRGYISHFSIGAAPRHARYEGPEFSGMSEKKQKRKLDKARLKGEKERAQMGLSNDDLLEVSKAGAGMGAGAPAAGGNKMLIYGAAALVVVILIVIMIKRR